MRGRPEEDEERLFVANNLAVSLKESAADNAGALRLMREVLAVRRRRGQDHPATRTLALALALALTLSLTLALTLTLTLNLTPTLALTLALTRTTRPRLTA